MDFEYTDEQQQLADALRKLLAGQYGFEQRKAIVASPDGCSERVWAAFAEMGLPAIALPESQGGFGGGAVALMPVMMACGEALVVEPLLDHVVAARLAARLGDAAQRDALLGGAADGTHRMTLAATEPGRRYALAPAVTTARHDGRNWVLDGAKCVVIGASAARTLLVPARTGGGADDAQGVSLFVVDRDAAGLQLNPYRTIDGQRAADLVLKGVRVADDALLGEPGGALAALDEAADFATALLCADAVGAMAYANETTLEYTKTRRQFGVAIASFQVLQHRMVEMAITLEQARSMAILAAAKVDAVGDARERARAVSGAKVKIADAARLISQEAVQLHGGMGMTEELKVSHTFRRLTMLAQRFGDADHHLERYAALG
jgi:alkylation response protein AidB-like acyl-CoA dehydrogenase